MTNKTLVIVVRLDLS